MSTDVLIWIWLVVFKSAALFWFYSFACNPWKVPRVTQPMRILTHAVPTNQQDLREGGPGGQPGCPAVLGEYEDEQKFRGSGPDFLRTRRIANQPWGTTQTATQGMWPRWPMRGLHTSLNTILTLVRFPNCHECSKWVGEPDYPHLGYGHGGHGP